MNITGTLVKTDLVQIAEQAGGHFHRHGHEERSCCPLHGGDNPSAFVVYTDENGKQRWKCYTGPCGGGDVFDFVMAWKATDFVGAYQFLGGERRPDPAEVERVARIREERARIAKEEKEREHARALADLHNAQSWKTYHDNLTAESRALWEGRGINPAFQDYWMLGYCPEFTVMSSGERFTTPSLTIPIMDTAGTVINVRHRLLSPPSPNDKYRPDRPGLPAAPFISWRDAGFNTDPILVVEGEIKSMVTFRKLWRKGDPYQVIGIPGKTQFRSILDNLRGHDVYICFDPDADQQAHEAARAVGGKVITLPVKIDDAIINGWLTRRDLQVRMKSARKV